MEVVVSLMDVNKASNMIEDSQSLSSLLEENNLYPNHGIVTGKQIGRAHV